MSKRLDVNYKYNWHAKKIRDKKRSVEKSSKNLSIGYWPKEKMKDILRTELQKRIYDFKVFIENKYEPSEFIDQFSEEELIPDEYYSKKYYIQTHYLFNPKRDPIYRVYKKTNNVYSTIKIYSKSITIITSEEPIFLKNNEYYFRLRDIWESREIDVNYMTNYIIEKIVEEYIYEIETTYKLEDMILLFSHKDFKRIKNLISHIKTQNKAYLITNEYNKERILNNGKSLLKSDLYKIMNLFNSISRINHEHNCTNEEVLDSSLELCEVDICTCEECQVNGYSLTEETLKVPYENLLNINDFDLLSTDVKKDYRVVDWEY